MRDDLPAAAFRLACALPARTHEWQPKRVEPMASRKPPKKHAVTGTGRGVQNKSPIFISGATVREHLCEDEPQQQQSTPGSKAPVIVAGVRYESITEARLKLKCGNSRIYGMIDRGEARWA